MSNRLFDTYNEALFQAPDVLTQERLAQGIQKYRGYERPQDRSARILEIGCGVGYFLHFLNRNGYLNIQGIDLSPQMIGVCKATLSNIQAEKAKTERVISRIIFFWITKMMQYQRFVAPRILTPLIFAQVIRDHDPD